MSYKKLVAIALLILLFIILGFSLKNPYIGSLNDSINLFTQKIQIPFLITISKAVSNIFEIYGVIIIALILSAYLFLTKRKKESVISLLIVGLSSASTTILKIIYAIPRPINALISETDFSFPSGHSSIAVVLFGLFAYFYIKDSKRNKIPAILISIVGIIIVAFSRLYLNVHWFTDIIGGLIIGSIWLLLALYLLEKIKTPLLKVKNKK